MKRIILVRHGRYDTKTGHLYDPQGVKDAKDAAESIQIKIENAADVNPAGERVLILTSPKDRARETAEIILRQLDDCCCLIGPVEVNDALDDDGDDMERLFLAILSVNDYCDTLVLVTHLNYVCGFRSYYLKRVKGQDWDAFKTAREGETVLINR